MKMPRKELQLLISLSAKHTVFIIIVPKMRKLNSFNKDSWLADYLDLAAMEQEVTVLRFLATGTRTQASRESLLRVLCLFSLFMLYFIFSLFSLLISVFCSRFGLLTQVQCWMEVTIQVQTVGPVMEITGGAEHLDYIYLNWPCLILHRVTWIDFGTERCLYAATAEILLLCYMFSRDLKTNSGLSHTFK